MKTSLGETAELGKAAVKEGQKLLEEGDDTGKNIIEGVTGIFKSEKKD